MDLTDDFVMDEFKCMANETMNCSRIKINLTEIMNVEPSEKHPIVYFSQRFYAYVTPIIFTVGLFGNIMSLSVFLTKNLRNMSASRYLSALSIADMSTLIFYVFGEWLRRGLKYISPGIKISFLDTEGVCQIWLYLNYFSRFMSAWLIVCFTCERFIGVCMPLRRRNLGTLKETTKIISALTVVAAVIVSYKPFLSDVHTIRTRTSCASKKNYVYESFVLDSIYALLITFVPFIVITTLNVLIVRRLIIRNRRQKHNLITEESHIRLEFTFILLAISIFFIAFNLPFFATWFRNFVHSHFLYPNETNIESDKGSVDYWIGVLLITRTIFYMNYCINFFLYSFTGAYFRKELKGLFFTTYQKYDHCKHSVNTHETHMLRRNSWV
ncbi:cysteinyl leukotriene receptor 1-like [Mercenaria mercenaria]|uniref:cysteinyl leukotriene receptor 1-like n=1 Tax=Mercenaria mercenaria TaxID=6596 RepID=UPI00234F7BB7|nr:cysteinyl leukotriene receptor 1-like [Mercenaria mercenaria]